MRQLLLFDLQPRDGFPDVVQENRNQILFYSFSRDDFLSQYITNITTCNYTNVSMHTILWELRNRIPGRVYITVLILHRLKATYVHQRVGRWQSPDHPVLLIVPSLTILTAVMVNSQALNYRHPASDLH